MNKNSVICRFIAEHPTDWEALMDDAGIKVKKEGSYAIFNYAIPCDFYNPLVQEARGIIVDYNQLEVVCWPFRKFGNYQEGYADEIDWSTAKVQEKVDGSIVKLWYDKRLNTWQFSTNGMLRAEYANVDTAVGMCYMDLIYQADNFGDIPFDRLDKDYTYIFELVSPISRVVVRYEKTSLYHLGTRNNLTGEECDMDIGIKKPQLYPLSSLEDCEKAAAALNKGNDSAEIEKEGFVVVDARWHRVKIKSIDYITMHHVSMMKTLTKKDCIDWLRDERGRLDLVMKENPTLIPTIKYYDYRLEELLLNADQMVDITRRLYEEYSHDRRAVAQVISKHRLSAIGFSCLGNDKTGRELVLEQASEKICKFIPDYQPEDWSSLSGVLLEKRRKKSDDA